MSCRRCSSGLRTDFPIRTFCSRHSHLLSRFVAEAGITWSRQKWFDQPSTALCECSTIRPHGFRPGPAANHEIVRVIGDLRIVVPGVAQRLSAPCCMSH